MNGSIGEILSQSEKKLQTAHMPADDAAILISHILGTDKSELFAHPDTLVSIDQRGEIQKMIAQRMAGMSVAVLVGHKEFYGLDFIIDEHTLVPRPETELLVDSALSHLKNNDYQSVLDMGTGSGCIIISIAKNTDAHRHVSFFGIDISEHALVIARKNAKKIQAKVHFIESNLFSECGDQKFTLLIANLPYLTTAQLNEPSIKQEPVGALWGGSDGLDIYREFLKQAKDHLAEHGVMMLEIDPSQTDPITKKVQSVFPESSLTVLKDLSGHDRVVIINA